MTGGWGWTTLDVSTGYGDYLVAQTEEICDRYDVDGFFFDICPEVLPVGQARVRETGVRPDDERAVLRFAEEELKSFLERLRCPDGWEINRTGKSRARARAARLR